MFRHRGHTRTYSHNLRIASLLSFVAGVVNVVGFLSVHRLTTNVTGHFAYVMEEVLRLQWWKGFVYFLYVFFFFIGSFTSGLLVEWISLRSERYMYTVPALIECIILLVVGISGPAWSETSPDALAYSLLFAMGLQNSLVTTISSANVRTTHLTGLFTDLGIELSQIFFYKTSEQKTRLLSSMRLRFTIIVFFFTGGIAGGLLYGTFALRVLALTAALLFAGLIYDTIKFRIIQVSRKIKNNV